MKQYDEKTIIEGCISNDRHFQELLYKQHFPKMMSMCMHHANGDKNTAMEMLNAGMLRVFQNIHKFEFRGSFEGWIRRIIYHVIIDFHKQNARNSHFLIFEEKDEAVAASGLQNCYVEDILTLVEQLPPTTQRVFKLYAIEGFSHKEIGEALNISDGTSKWHLSNAREKLKQLIENQYFIKINNAI
jgi:RNA polymerase sigma factor (sigma-70 family)